MGHGGQRLPFSFPRATKEPLPKQRRLSLLTTSITNITVFFSLECFLNRESRQKKFGRCQTHGFNFPVYLDPDLKVARQFGAHVTPEMFLLDSQGKLLYRGSEQGITGALTAFQAGSAIPPSELKVQGTELGKCWRRLPLVILLLRSISHPS